MADAMIAARPHTHRHHPRRRVIQYSRAEVQSERPRDWPAFAGMTTVAG